MPLAIAAFTAVQPLAVSKLEPELQEELKAKTARLEELNALLNLDKREPEVVDAEPDENQRPPARPAAQMER